MLLRDRCISEVSLPHLYKTHPDTRTSSVPLHLQKKNKTKTVDLMFSKAQVCATGTHTHNNSL